MKQVLITLIIVIVAAITIGTLVWRNSNTIDKDESVETIQNEITSDTIDNYSIEDYLQFRNDMRQQQEAEQIFLNMPDVVLIDILLQHGTELSPYDIGEIYKNYPDIYNEVQSGARSQRYLDSINNKN